MLIIADGVRLGRSRRHLLAVCKLNRETWAFIRAETDDDHEWLPNANQHGVIGLPVTDQMINRWLAMVDQLEGLLEGERLFPGNLLAFFYANTGGKGLNVKTLLDDPPVSISAKELKTDGVDAKYLQANGTKPDFDFNVLFAVARMFDGPLGVAYMTWFN